MRERIGHYELRERLGEGGFGQVFRAWDDKLCRLVAIKRLTGPAAAQPTADLVREARLSASLKHPAFVRIHAIEEEAGRPFIVMELVDGSTLQKLAAEGPMDEARALDIVYQAAQAMDEAHASGLVHADLKPSNLMVEPQGAVRILDFGLAAHADMQATTSMAQLDPQGTIAYMAPERMLGEPPGRAGDVYALGVILYELVNGARPFASLGGLALAAAQMQSSSAQWPMAGQVRPELAALVRDMTHRNPCQRPPSMRDVCQRIDTLRARGTGARVPRSVAGRLRLPAFGKRVRIALGTGLAVVALAAGWNLREQAISVLTPYSEAASMREGLEALRVFDRPGSIDKAIARFNAILAHSPNSAGGAAGLSLAYSLRYGADSSDDTWLQRADAAAQRALQLDDQLALAHTAAGWVADKKGKAGNALGLFDHALALDPNGLFAMFGKINALRRARKFDEALALAGQGRKAFPRERIFADAVGSILMAQSDYKGAEQAFRDSIRIEPDAVIAYANLNAALLRQNRSDEALQVLQQGLQVRPNPSLYTNLGNALFQRADYVGAARAFELAVSPDKGKPDSYLYWANLGDALLWLPGRAEDARKAYARAIDLLEPRLKRTPNDVNLTSRMGLYSARVGNKERAAALSRQALGMAPDNADVRFRAALAFELGGDRTAALAEIAAARRLGFPLNFIEAEPDLAALRRDPQYLHQ